MLLVKQQLKLLKKLVLASDFGVPWMGNTRQEVLGLTPTDVLVIENDVLKVVRKGMSGPRLAWAPPGFKVCHTCQSVDPLTDFTVDEACVARVSRMCITCSSHQSMIDRCYNERHKRYHDYGGKGTRVCDEWLDPETGAVAFRRDMGGRPSINLSIDRIDGDKHYTPDNCRWADPLQQILNRKSTIWLTHGGKTLCRKHMAAEHGLSEATLRHRLTAGWPLERALTQPVHPALQPRVKR